MLIVHYNITRWQVSLIREPQAHRQMVVASSKKHMKANHSETMKGHRIKKYAAIRGGGREERKEGIGRTRRDDILAKSCCTHDRKPAHAVKWCARHEVPRRLLAFLFLLRLATLPPLPSSSSSSSLACAPRGLDRFRETVQIKQVKMREGRRRTRERETEREREGGREWEKRKEWRWRKMVGCSTSHSPPAPSVAPLHRRRCARASQGHHMLTVYRTDITGDHDAFIVLNIVPVARND